MDIKIIIATHKKYWMPNDEMYLPLHVGAWNKESIGYLGDCTGENISDKNANYCELTGLYWAWKNLKVDYIGLVHYRRHFANARWGKKENRVLTEAQAKEWLEDADVILPSMRNYYIETNYTQYVHAHNAADLDITRMILVENHPDYVDAFDHVMKQTKGHRFNMCIMRKDKFDAYCSWLFSVLMELEKRLDISAYSKYDARVFGFVSERLLDVWVEANDIAYKEVPYVFMEQQNWFCKIYSFLMRKFFGVKDKN